MILAIPVFNKHSVNASQNDGFKKALVEYIQDPSEERFHIAAELSNSPGELNSVMAFVYAELGIKSANDGILSDAIECAIYATQCDALDDVDADYHIYVYPYNYDSSKTEELYQNYVALCRKAIDDILEMAKKLMIKQYNLLARQN